MMNEGVFTLGFINTFLRTILDAINGVVHNYGWSIVIFTILIRIALLPLDLKQKREAKKMNDIQPLLQEINEKYKNDAEKRNQKTMELYKEKKINPFGGCLPMLIQLPILFALFAVLREIADQQTLAIVDQVRNGAKTIQFESWLWVRNIWQPDSFLAGVLPDKVAKISDYATVMKDVLASYKDITNGWFILPILAGLSQFFQMKTMNAGGTPQQQKGFMYFFPIFSVYICATYNAAFSIYWVAGNLFQIAQQYIINMISPDLVRPNKEGNEK